MSLPGLLVLHPGTFSTVQDLGRPGWRRFGVPVGGAFDLAAFRLANALMGNASSAPALELTLVGGSFQALCTLAVALAGAPMMAEIESLNGDLRPLSAPRAFLLREGEILHLRAARSGARAYLAVRGGIQTGPTLNSRSRETPLQAGDLLPARPGSTSERWPRPGTIDPEPLDPLAPLRILPGPDADSPFLSWTPEARFRVAPLSNRVGVRLETGDFALPSTSDPLRRSAPVAAGAIQRTPSGLIILGPACGTMGGYPHVAHVISADLDRLGQLRPGDPVGFSIVELSEARRLDAQRRLFLLRRDARIRASF